MLQLNLYFYTQTQTESWFLFCFVFCRKNSCFCFSNLQRLCKHHSLSVEKAHSAAYYNSDAKMFLFMNNKIIHCNTPHSRDDRAFLFGIKTRLCPLLRWPIIFMLSLLSRRLCHFPALFPSLAVWYDVLAAPCQTLSLEFRDGEFITGLCLITDSRLK